MKSGDFYENGWEGKIRTIPGSGVGYSLKGYPDADGDTLGVGDTCRLSSSFLERVKSRVTGE